MGLGLTWVCRGLTPALAGWAHISFTQHSPLSQVLVVSLMIAFALGRSRISKQFWLAFPWQLEDAEHVSVYLSAIGTSVESHLLTYLHILYYLYLINMETIVSFTCQQLDTPGKRNQNWRITSIQLASGHVYGDIFLIVNWCRRAHPTLCGSVPGQLGLGCLRKAAEKARRSKVSQQTVFLCGVYLRLLPWAPALPPLDDGLLPVSQISFPVYTSCFRTGSFWLAERQTKKEML